MLRRLIGSCITRISVGFWAPASPGVAIASHVSEASLQHLPQKLWCSFNTQQPNFPASSRQHSSTSTTPRRGKKAARSTDKGTTEPASTQSLIGNASTATAAAAAPAAETTAPEGSAAAAAIVVRDSTSAKARIIHPKDTAEDATAELLSSSPDAEHGPGVEWLQDSTSKGEQQLLHAAPTALPAGGAARKRRKRASPSSPFSTPSAPATSLLGRHGNAAAQEAQAAGRTAAAHDEVHWEGTWEQKHESFNAIAEQRQQQLLHQASVIDLGSSVDTPEALEVIKLAHERAAKKQLPMEMLAQAITNALELSRHTNLDARALLSPAIAQMKLEFAQEQAAKFRRLLPDTQLRAELLGQDPQDISDKIAHIIAAFKTQLSMQPPTQLLTNSWTFTKALRLHDKQLQFHLALLHQMVGDEATAQQLAQQHTGALVSKSCPLLLEGAKQLAVALGVEEIDALKVVLSHPELARTPRQLQQVLDLIADAPDALGLPRDQLFPCFVKHPDMLKYSSSNALAQIYKALVVLFREGSPAPVPPSDILYICSAQAIRAPKPLKKAGIDEPIPRTPADLVASLRTAAAIFGCSSPAELLPWLLRPPGPPDPRNNSRYPYINTLVQPVEQMASRAAWFLQDESDLQQLQKMIQQSPILALGRDKNTQQLKLSILEGQLLGRDPDYGSNLTPEVTRMLKKFPWVASLQVETCRQRVAALEAALQLQQGQGGQLVLRVPRLLMLQPQRIADLISELQQALGEQKARTVLLADPQVLLFSNRAKSGGFQQHLQVLQALLMGESYSQLSDTASSNSSSSGSSSTGALPDAAAPAGSSAVAKAGTGRTAKRASSAGSHVPEYQQLLLKAKAAAKDAADRAIRKLASGSSKGGRRCTSGQVDQVDHGLRGVIQRSSSWQMQTTWRIEGPNSNQQLRTSHPSPLEAACAYDLACLAAKRGSAANLPGHRYTSKQVAAMGALITFFEQQEPQQQQLQQQDQVAAAAAAAVAAAAARASSSGLSGDHGLTGVRQKVGAAASWEMRSKLVYGKGKLYSSSHGSALEAACAFDLVRLALLGGSSAVNLPAGAYTEEEVAAMSAHLQLKQQQQHQQQQQQVQHEQQEEQQQQQQQAEFISSLGDQQQQNQQDQQVQQPLPPLFIACLRTKAGRHLLNLKPATGLARLQALADLTDTSMQSILARCLRSNNFLQGVLALPQHRMEAAAVGLQQQLGLSGAQLQQLLRAAPHVLVSKPETLAARVQLLLPAFTGCWTAVAAAAAAAGSSAAAAAPEGLVATTTSSSSSSTGIGGNLGGGVAQQQLELQAAAAADGLACMQRAVLYAPQLLGLNAERVAWRLEVLSESCCGRQDLLQQLQQALVSGSVGRWLAAGDARYKALQQLTNTAAPASSSLHFTADGDGRLELQRIFKMSVKDFKLYWTSHESVRVGWSSSTFLL